MTEKSKTLLSIILAVVMAFGMIPVIGGSTAKAVNASEITLEFGTGHEALAADFAEYLNGDESPLPGCDATADDSKVKFYYTGSETNIGRVQTYIGSLLVNFMGATYLDNEDRLHSASFWSDFNYYIGQQTLDKYSGDVDIINEIRESSEVRMPDKQTFFVLWDKPINNVSLSVKPPVCGVETKINDDSETQTNPPQVTSSGQHHSLQGNSYWYDFNDFAWFMGIFKGGNEYTVNTYLSADFGYYFPEDVEYSIERGLLVPPEDFPEYQNNPWIADSSFEVFYRVKAVHDPGTPVKRNEVKPTCTKDGSYEEIAYCKACKEEVSKEKKTVNATDHSWNEGKVTKKATCTENGVKTYTCKNDSSHKKTESIAATGHKWGEWKVAKKATSKAAGEKKRVCKVCGETEKNAIPKLKNTGPLMVKTAAKGKDKLKIRWNKIDRAAGYVIFMNKCNYNGRVHKLRKAVAIEKSNKCKWTAKKLDENTCYKLCIRAYKYKNGKKKYFRKSPLLHVFTGNFRGKFTNVKAVKVKKKKVTLAKGDKFKIKARAIKMIADKKLPVTHAPVFRYRSSNTDIVKVTSKGKIKARKEGKAKVYVYVHNGKYKAVSVKVE